MVSTIRDFIIVYIDTYYPSQALLEHDHELQAWIYECIEEAHVLDFPTFPLTSRDTFVSILTYIAVLTGIAHHVLNDATPGESSGVLPLHPSAFNLPLPTTKNSITDLLPYLHNETEALKQASLLVRFNRPLIGEQEGSLVDMFSEGEFLAMAGMEKVSEAAEIFKRSMKTISDGIRARFGTRMV